MFPNCEINSKLSKDFDELMRSNPDIVRKNPMDPAKDLPSRKTLSGNLEKIRKEDQPKHADGPKPVI